MPKITQDVRAQVLKKDPAEGWCWEKAARKHLLTQFRFVLTFLTEEKQRKRKRHLLIRSKGEETNRKGNSSSKSSTSLLSVRHFTCNSNLSLSLEIDFYPCFPDEKTEDQRCLVTGHRYAAQPSQSQAEKPSLCVMLDVQNFSLIP